MQNFDNRAIGVFDSGMGGLTVAAAIKKILPNEKIIYLGDLLHLPYGSKSSRAVLDFTGAAVRFLMQQDVKLLVLACNTAASIAMKQVEKEVDIPVIGVIAPGAYSACGLSRSRRIGVIGTTRTIESGAYVAAITLIDPEVTVFQKATPLLVPLIEEGWIDHPVLGQVLEEYLQIFLEKPVDTIVLGCTHYPLIKHRIRDILERVLIADSAETTAERVYAVLCQGKFSENVDVDGSFQIFLTDCTENFKIVGERIIGKKVLDVKLIELDYSKGQMAYNL